MERAEWVTDKSFSSCQLCGQNFSLFIRRHHCRVCGLLFCDSCSQRRLPLPFSPFLLNLRKNSNIINNNNNNNNNGEDINNNNNNLIVDDDSQRHSTSRLSGDFSPTAAAGIGPAGFFPIITMERVCDLCFSEKKNNLFVDLSLMDDVFFLLLPLLPFPQQPSSASPKIATFHPQEPPAAAAAGGISSGASAAGSSSGGSVSGQNLSMKAERVRRGGKVELQMSLSQLRDVWEWENLNVWFPLLVRDVRCFPIGGNALFLLLRPPKPQKNAAEIPLICQERSNSEREWYIVLASPFSPCPSSPLPSSSSLASPNASFSSVGGGGVIAASIPPPPPPSQKSVPLVNVVIRAYNLPNERVECSVIIEVISNSKFKRWQVARNLDKQLSNLLARLRVMAEGSAKRGIIPPSRRSTMLFGDPSRNPRASGPFPPFFETNNSRSNEEEDDDEEEDRSFYSEETSQHGDDTDQASFVSAAESLQDQSASFVSIPPSPFHNSNNDNSNRDNNNGNDDGDDDSAPRHSIESEEEWREMEESEDLVERQQTKIMAKIGSVDDSAIQEASDEDEDEEGEGKRKGVDADFKHSDDDESGSASSSSSSSSDESDENPPPSSSHHHDHQAREQRLSQQKMANRHHVKAAGLVKLQQTVQSLDKEEEAAKGGDYRNNLSDAHRRRNDKNNSNSKALEQQQEAAAAAALLVREDLGGGGGGGTRGSLGGESSAMM